MNHLANNSGEPPFSWRTLRWLALIFLILKLAALALFQPFMDETYYWMWGQHPALSYFDHPPLVAWVNWVSGAIFGWNRFALRLPVLLTLIGDLGMIYLFARRLGGERWQETFWLTALLFLATPAFELMTGVALPDHLMILALLAALYCFHGVLLAHDAGRRDNRLLYLGAAALGFALLAKLYVGLFAIALVLFLVISRRYRALLGNPHVWLAMLVVLAMQTPVIVWNMQHDYAGLQFALGGRQSATRTSPVRGVSGYLFGIVFMLSPFLLVAAGRFLIDRRDDAARLARTIAWVSTLAFLAASFTTSILIHWNVIAYVAMLPFIGFYLRSRVALVLHLTFGALLLGLLTVNYALVPVTALPSLGDQTSVWSHGWEETAERVRAAEATQKVGFIAGTSYELASALGFAMHDPDVTSLARRQDAYDSFFDAKAHAGESALIVADRWRGIGAAEGRFETLEKIDSVEIWRFGRLIATREIYLGSGFVP